MHSRVKVFLNNYTNKGTKKNMLYAIKTYFESHYQKVTSKNIEDLAEKYFNERKNTEGKTLEKKVEQDILNYLTVLNGQAPLSIKLKISNIKTFLIENDVELPLKFWKKIGRSIKGSRALTLDRIPTSEEMKKIIMHMPIQGKALFLFLESSGMRIGETLKINIEDVNLELNPSRVQIRGEYTKTGNSRYSFISSEAKETIIEWLKVREDYIQSAINKSHLYKKSLKIEYVDRKTGETKTRLDTRLFPFFISTAYSVWTKALHKAGLNGKDKSTNREKIHPHVLRKYFRTKLGAAIPVDVVEALMGHEGYLTEVYRKHSLEDLAKFYLKGEPALLIFTNTQKIVEFQETIKKENLEMQKKVETRNTELQIVVNGLYSENRELKQRLEQIENGNKKKKEENLQLKKEVADIKGQLLLITEALKKRKSWGE